MPQLPCSPDLAPLTLPFPKHEDTDERNAFSYDWGEERKTETVAGGDTKKRVSEVFRELEKKLASVYYTRGDYFEGDKIVIGK